MVDYGVKSFLVFVCTVAVTSRSGKETSMAWALRLHDWFGRVHLRTSAQKEDAFRELLDADFHSAEQEMGRERAADTVIDEFIEKSNRECSGE